MCSGYSSTYFSIRIISRKPHSKLVYSSLPNALKQKQHLQLLVIAVDPTISTRSKKTSAWVVIIVTNYHKLNYWVEMWNVAAKYEDNEPLP